MAETFAEKMVSKYEALLEANAGVKQVTVDGQAVSYGDLEQRLEYWRRKVAVERGKRPRAAGIRLDRF